MVGERRSRLRVVHVAPYFYPSGGIEAHLFELTKRLARLCDVKILASKPGKNLVLPWGAEVEYFSSVDAVALPIKPKVRYPFPFGMLAKVAQEECDVVHVHGHHYPTSFVARRACSLSHKPYVLTVHSPRTMLMEHAIVRQVRKILDKEIRKTVASAEACIAVTEKVRRYLEEFFEPKRVELIRHGVEVRFLPEGEDVVFVGRLVDYKHPDVFVRAAAKIAKEIPAKFYVVGGGPLLGELKRLCKELGVGKRIVFAGQLPRRKVREYVRRARVFVAPYLTGGLAVLEALAMGRVVVGMRGDEPTDQVILQIESLDVEEVAEKVLSAYLDEKLRRSLLEKTKEVLKRYYSWEECIRKHMKIYEALA